MLQRLSSTKTKKYIILGIILASILAVGALAWRQAHHQPVHPEKTNHQVKQTPKPVAKTPPPSYIDQTLASMTLRDKVASLFVFHTPGTSPTKLASYFTAYQAGGLIFMGDNIPNSFQELQAETSALTSDKQLPPLIATDEEGDTVTRLASDIYPGAKTLRNLPPAAAQTAFAARSNLLKRGGINLNFGIDADVTADPNSFIFPRVLGTTPQAAADRVAQAVIGTEGVTLSTIKHFPGHGETGADSHTSIPSTSVSFDTWQQRDAVPFQAGINAGADLVMFGHLRYTAVDDQPATLSSKWHDIIRSQLHFKGVIITDDMIMLQNSGNDAYDDPVANAIAALQAGNDALLYVLDHGSPSVDKTDPNTLINGVVAAVTDGRISQAAIDLHVRQILAIRHAIGTSWYGQ